MTIAANAVIARRMEYLETETFENLLALRADEVEQLLRQLLDGRLREGEVDRPRRLIEAMRHGALNGGKRLRPFLLVETAEMFEHGGRAALRSAAALECVHCYSLIHDDLPAMDNDDMRRGQPTVHRAFDEASAILAGDSLLTYAFDIIADAETELPATTRLELVLKLARAAGLGGMAGGQALDLEAERVFPDEGGIIKLQAMKTGALIRYACEAGAIIGHAGPADIERLGAFGSAIGLAFQLADDLLDLTATPESVGKATGKDAEAGKATLARLHGEEWVRSQLKGLVGQAEELLEPYGERAAILRHAARFVAARNR
ncbi:Farnesyl diphosphate synthase [Nitratireductor thuwali]|uniref:Farnesyl diphosphate synthase n=2 Tax=Nitratireductor thuwali TaxID=2267699 RepID=A0ABY5MHQ2_9HYPH|nr:Farnesyl diphosphate synthase [Nitratireductor thuwali]